MTLGEKTRKPFGIFSLLGRKNKEQGADQAQSHHQASHIHHSTRGQSSGSASAHSASYSHHDAGHHAQAHAPPPAPTTDKHGFYPSVQYERLVPSVSQRPPTSEPHHPSPNVYEGSSSAVQYERLTPSSAMAPSVQYERLTPASASSGPIKYERVAPSGAFLHSPAPLPVQAPKTSMTSPLPRLPSPAQFEHAADPGRYQLTTPSPSLPSPSLSSLPSPGMLTPLTAQMGQMSVDVTKHAYRTASQGPAPPSASNRVAASPDTIMAEGVTPDGSTPFAAVMGEWISQRRTPTPDVTLLPSPFAYNQDTPTPVERVDDLNRIHEALLPTPPPDLHAHSQSTKSQEYLRSVGRRPLLEDIASLCRDLIHQESDQTKTLPSIQQLRIVEEKPYPDTGRARPESVYDDDDDECTTDMSRGTGKSKRRKMCSADGCANLSRSRGLCKAHGGGRRCTVEGCSRASQSGSLCITHGGGKRCTVDGCEKAAQSRGMCKAHGGGVRCRVDGCQKSSQGDGFCRSHGGGRRCGHTSGCTKWAQRNGMCMAHSEGKYGNSYRGRLNRMLEEQHTS